MWSSPDVALPELASLPGAASVDPPDEHRLEAGYFDTTDLALARYGVRLRRRTGGEDDGWHVKLPTDDGAKELHVPLGRAVAAPPARVRRLVRAYTRGRRLVPAATIRTDRAVYRIRDGEGTVLAEFCDDRVSGFIPGVADVRAWREWEIELVGAPKEFLERAAPLVTEAGAATANYVSKLHRVLGTAVVSSESLTPLASSGGPAVNAALTYIATGRDQILHLDPALRTRDPHALHDLVIAVRRDPIGAGHLP